MQTIEDAWSCELVGLVGSKLGNVNELLQNRLNQKPSSPSKSPKGPDHDALD